MLQGVLSKFRRDPQTLMDEGNENTVEFGKAKEPQLGDAPQPMSLSSSSSTQETSVGDGDQQEAGSDYNNEQANTQDDSDDSDDSEESISDEEEDTTEEEDPDNVHWIRWFCSQPGNEIYCEVDESFITDQFNLTGLQRLVPYYNEALEVIMDLDPDGTLSPAELNEIDKSTGILFKLIHQRFLMTRAGMSMMYEKYTNFVYGKCPRVLCNYQATLPVGCSDYPGHGKMKLFCPRCLDLYEFPRRSAPDGCAFGTTAAHLLMASFPDVFEDVQKLRRTVSVDLPNRHATAYQPRIFGFHLHDSNPVSAKMAWLRRMRTEPKRTEETNNEDIYKEHNPLSGSD